MPVADVAMGLERDGAGRFGLGDVAERAPRDQLKLAADGVLRVGDREVEAKRDASEGEVGQVLSGEEMAELVVGVEQNQDREIGLIAEDTADREP